LVGGIQSNSRPLTPRYLIPALVLCVIASNCYLAFQDFLGQGLASFGEDRLATLLCSLARFDLANRGMRQPVSRTPTLLVFDETSA